MDCSNCSISYNKIIFIDVPHGWSKKIPRGGGAKGWKFPRGMGGAHEKNFHRVIKDMIDRTCTRHNYVDYFICSTTKIRIRCTIDALARKNLKLFVSNVLFFAGSSLSSL